MKRNKTRRNNISWSPVMTPDKYRQYEVKVLKNNSHIFASGVGITFIDKEHISKIKRNGFDTSVTIYNSLDVLGKSNKIIAFCHFIIINKDDADITHKNKIIINNRNAVVIIGYLNEFTSTNSRQWTPVKSISDGYKYLKSVAGSEIYIGFHGTGEKVAETIRKDGFRNIDTIRGLEYSASANYFTPYPWYAYNWAHTNKQKGTILVCLMSFKKPMPENIIKKIQSVNDIDKRTDMWLEKASKYNYDGCNLGDEIWVWNPQSVVIIGEIKYI